MVEAIENYKKFIDPLDGFFEDKIEITNNRNHFIPTDELHSTAKDMQLMKTEENRTDTIA